MKNIVCIIILITFACKSFGQKNNWKHFSDTQLPAYIEELTFNDGVNLNKNSSVSWGGWTVRFASSTTQPVIFHNSRIGAYYVISGLKANNKVTGDHPCAIAYFKEAHHKDGSLMTKEQWVLWVLEDSEQNFGVNSDYPQIKTIYRISFPNIIKLNQ
jgi:hypothetical protein